MYRVGGDLIREAMLLYWVGAKGRFIGRKPRSRGDSVLPRGDILRGRYYFVTPAHVAETMKFMAGTFKWPSFTRCRHEGEHY